MGGLVLAEKVGDWPDFKWRVYCPSPPPGEATIWLLPDSPQTIYVHGVTDGSLIFSCEPWSELSLEWVDLGRVPDAKRILSLGPFMTMAPLLKRTDEDKISP